MQYITRGDMNPFLRLFSNLKDAFAYFGLKEVFLRPRKVNMRGRGPPTPCL
jgi:hypothetical protein